MKDLPEEVVRRIASFLCTFFSHRCLRAVCRAVRVAIDNTVLRSNQCCPGTDAQRVDTLLVFPYAGWVRFPESLIVAPRCIVVTDYTPWVGFGIHNVSPPHLCFVKTGVDPNTFFTVNYNNFMCTSMATQQTMACQLV